MRRRSLVLLGSIVAIVIAVTSAWVGWLPIQPIWQGLRPETAHQRYGRSLVEGGLAHTALAIDWLAAAARALQQPVTVSVPFVEEALVDPARPNSLGYAVTLERGQTLTVQVSVVTDTPGRVFVDLFEPNTNRAETNRPVASAPEDQTELSYEAQRSGTQLCQCDVGDAVPCREGPHWGGPDQLVELVSAQLSGWTIGQRNTSEPNDDSSYKW